MITRAFFELGKLYAESKSFATSSPLRFAVAVVFLFFYVLVWWAAIYRLSNFEFPSPPDLRMPFLGEPYEWKIDNTITTTLVMTVIWIGAVKVASKASQRT